MFTSSMKAVLCRHFFLYNEGYVSLEDLYRVHGSHRKGGERRRPRGIWNVVKSLDWTTRLR